MNPPAVGLQGLRTGEVDLRPEPASSKGVSRVPKTWRCASWDTPARAECGQDARLYPCGPRCDAHSPAAVSGRPVPVPAPEWTAKAFRERAGHRRDPLDNLPDQCPHAEPKGPRYCALCRRKARLESL